MVSLRLAVHDDIPLLQAIEVDAGELFREIGLARVADDPPPAAAVLAAHIADGTAWVAELDGEVVGYAVASVVDGEGHLDQVSVRRAAGGRGIGRVLVEEVCGWSAGRGLHAVTLTNAAVPWNGPLYERMGFVAVTDGECGPELAGIREAERAAGLDVLPRTAMRRHL